MRTFLMALALVALCYAGARAADWLNAGGDASHSGWQKRERYLKLENVKNLQLLWRLKLDSNSRASNSLVGPVMLGPIITHRGIKELVFAAGASNTIFAVDDDLGRLFWKRQIETSVPLAQDMSSPCGLGLTAAPAIEPDRKPPPAVEDDDYRTSIRPLYLLASDGRLHQISPATGLDTGPAREFLKPGVNASALTFANDLVTTQTKGGCGGVLDGLWSIHLPEGKVERVASPEPLPVTAWEDSEHVRWTYEISHDGVTAFRNGHQRAWSSANTSAKILSPKQPIVSSGVLLVLSAGNETSNAVLYAFDARSGQQLYSSGDSIKSFVQSSGLALANGHITFATNDNTLYCFGFPIEIF